MKMVIEKMQNGYVIEMHDNEGVYREVCESEIYDAEGLKKVLDSVICFFEDANRHCEKRCYAVVAPGDKNLNHSDEIFKALEVLRGLE